MNREKEMDDFKYVLYRDYTRFNGYNIRYPVAPTGRWKIKRDKYGYNTLFIECSYEYIEQLTRPKTWSEKLKNWRGRNYEIETGEEIRHKRCEWFPEWELRIEKEYVEIEYINNCGEGNEQDS